MKRPHLSEGVLGVLPRRELREREREREREKEWVKMKRCLLAAGRRSDDVCPGVRFTGV